MAGAPSQAHCSTLQRYVHYQARQNILSDTPRWPSSTQTLPATATSLPDLPPEIRNRIYEFTLLHDVYVFASAYILVAEPGLLRCNSQIRSEAYSIFWSRNTFYFPHASTAQMSLWLLHRSKTAAMRSVHVCIPEFVTEAPDCLPYIQRTLRELNTVCARKGIKSDVIKMPLKVMGEDEICWVSMHDVEGFEVDQTYKIVRKPAPVMR
ncbi:hypothetical protein DOTSEDRAFT_37338 [Dothistroma septosporum NZE10]|uniref:F-box domain-containing protein n=1 Tax=Dothistroma septosporum (strain NZE10 / CBS 128990) TaxID=675120 RepID=N1PD52_DOTSN|nr:hypothetical protein DOTSEDRAFT_37338 [Dothistroma septosporum NZE10]